MQGVFLFIIIQAIAAVVIGGVGIVAALAMGFVSGKAIIACFVGGFFFAFPVAWLIQKRMSDG